MLRRLRRSRRNEPHLQHGRKRRRIQKSTLVSLGALGVAVGFALLLFVIAAAQGLPSEEAISNIQIPDSTKIYDRTGEVLLYDVAPDKKRTVVPFDQIPQSLKDATISIEDERFYTNSGIDLQAIARALFMNTIRGKIIGQGASTITQQLARNAFLSAEQTFMRKVREALLAIKINRYYTKEEILALYLNEIPYGPMIYGVESASQTYFGKPARELTIAESALLAALPKAPSYYCPCGDNVAELIDRQHLVLQKMLDLEKIDQAQFDEAMRTELTFKSQFHGIKAPHFSLMIVQYLAETYGEEAVSKGGLKVISTLDWELQEAAEKAVETGGERNERLYGGKNAALVAQDPKTGQILAYVGARDYFNRENQGNFNVPVQGKRQPGSAFKPFVYMTGFEQGYVPQSILFDTPTEFAARNSKCPAVVNFAKDDPECFHPENFDNSFRGPVAIRQALAQSVNVPAVKMLYLVGLKNAIETANRFGLSTLTDPARYGLSLVLGGGEVRLIDLVGAYSILAAEGAKHKQAIVLEIKDSKGTVLESFTDSSEQVVDARYTRMTTGILADVGLRAPLFQSSTNLTVFGDYDVALKTGTTNDYRDAWAMGYTPSLTVGVWAGNNDNTPLHKQGSSILAAVPIWHGFLVEALKKYSPEQFNREEAPPPDKPMLNGEFVSENGVHDVLYYVDKSDPLGPPPSNPASDPQFENWEVGVQNWAAGHIDLFLTPPPNGDEATSTPTTTSSTEPVVPPDFFAPPL